MEKKLQTLFLSFLLISSYSSADDLNQAYSDGTSAAKDIKSKGQESLSTNNAENTVPGYTSNPSEESYYGGVRGDSGSLDSAAESVSSNNSTYKDVTSSEKTNPTPSINSQADYITNGTNSVANADKIEGNANSYCQDVSVSKSVFTNYTCNKQPYTDQSCERTATVGGHWVNNIVNTTYVIDSSNIKTVYDGGVKTKVCKMVGGYHDRYEKCSIEEEGASQKAYLSGLPNGTITSIDFKYTFNKNLAFSNPAWYSNVTLADQKFDMYDYGGAYNVGSSYSVNDGKLTLYFNNQENGSINVFSNHMEHFIATLNIRSGNKTYVPDVVWSDNCGTLASTGTKSDSVCVQGASDRQITVDGQTYTAHSDCWQYQDTYLSQSDDNGTCSTYSGNANCTVAGHSCTETTGNLCTEESVTYQCETKAGSTGQLCGGTYFCQSGDCQDTAATNDSGFNSSVSELAGLASAADDVKGTSMSVSAFTGDAVSCRKAMAGFADCCKDGGWGTSAGLAHCNSEEKAIGQAKEKKIVVEIGTTCAKKILGHCIQKKEVYCQFNGKLARIIQEQGRRDQLGISFGSANSPNCRGLTVDELQKINFDKINFSDFYSDLESQKNLPNNQQTIDEIKDKINSQVNAMKGK